jgi:hypothetical protein
MSLCGFPGKFAMSRKNNKKRSSREVCKNLRVSVNTAVADAFPGCIAEFCGGVERSRMATRGPTLGFRVKDRRGKYRSNIIWMKPTYTGFVSATWVADAVKSSNN